MPQVQHDTNSKIVLVALGSNATSTAGDARETVRAAVDELRAKFSNLVASRLYQTPAFPAGSGPDFVNAACRFSSDLSAVAILEVLHDIEGDFGRERQVRWGQRTLDLDLIGCGRQILPDVPTQTKWRDMTLTDQQKCTPDALILPHPRMQDRAFVLTPLNDIAPDWYHPLIDLSVSEMLARRPDSERDAIRLLSSAE